MRMIVRVLMAAGLCCAAAPAWAHHSFAVEYDKEKPVEGTGVLSKVEWTNPHMRIYVDCTDDKGVVTTWNLELGSPNSVLRRGWTKNSLLAGTEIMVEGFQAIDGTNKANGSVITTTDGKKLFVGSSAGEPGAAPGSTAK